MSFPVRRFLRLAFWIAVSFLVRTSNVRLDAAAPEWARDAVWYQIFPERFRNGDLSNDPVPASLEGTWPYEVPHGWKVSPWTSDWYELQPWEAANGKGFYHNAQLRRYGGDLQGILDRLDELKRLGVNALYLNPVFDSPSLHKYGAARFHHIDRHFGPDPRGDAAMFEREDPADPATWRWTSADRLFLKLVREAHRRRMRVVVDGVFNHVGIPFWALQRARREGPGSRFAEWFHITRWDDPKTPADEFEYRGWVGIRDLPELNRDAENLHPAVREHLHAVVRRWMDPDGDGDPSDGIDGWRLDVAAEVPMGFWREFRGWVKAIRPDAYLTGEVWWEDFGQNRFRNARPWLDQAFDGVMNYRFGDAVFRYLNQTRSIGPTRFAEEIRRMQDEYGYEACLALQNLMGSHDTARIGSAVVERNRDLRQDHDAGVQDHPGFDTRAPDAAAKVRWRQMVALQFLMPGAPYLYYGDEVGMWGADDPDCRKPRVWPDRRHAPEVFRPDGTRHAPDPVEVDQGLWEFHREWIRRRNDFAVLRRGDFRVLWTDDASGVLAFERRLGGACVVAVFNAGDVSARVPVERLGLKSGVSWRRDFGRRRPLRETVLEVPPHGWRTLERP